MGSENSPPVTEPEEAGQSIKASKDQTREVKERCDEAAQGSPRENSAKRRLSEDSNKGNESKKMKLVNVIEEDKENNSKGDIEETLSVKKKKKKHKHKEAREQHE